MKIAIQANPDRGKEIISLLESLGGKNYNEWKGLGERDFYYIDENNKIIFDYAPKGYKLYTLEEFEKEFPFKVGDKVLWPITIGWWSGIITGINEELSRYEIIDEKRDYHYVAPSKLRLYPMKEERNITLTLDKAKEWYKKGGELKEIALQAFSENELNPLPKSWEEYCKRYGACCFSVRYTSIPIKYDVLLKLEQLRDCWRQGWIPQKGDNGFGIRFDLSDGFETTKLCYYSAFLSFPTRETAEEFLKCFRDLIEKAGDLI